jgi:hypothetical protein
MTKTAEEDFEAQHGEKRFHDAIIHPSEKMKRCVSVDSQP